MVIIFSYPELLHRIWTVKPVSDPRDWYLFFCIPTVVAAFTVGSVVFSPAVLMVTRVELVWLSRVAVINTLPTPEAVKRLVARPLVKLNRVGLRLPRVPVRSTSIPSRTCP